MNILNLATRFATCLVVAYCGTMIIATVGRLLSESVIPFEDAPTGVWIMLGIGVMMIAMAMMFALPLRRVNDNH